MSKDMISFDEILNEVNLYIHKEENLEIINRAYHFAEEKHREQFRKSGDPYIIHALHVGLILAKLRTGPFTIAAGLLHDVIEDCDVTEEEFEALFGNEILTLVKAVTKIGNLKFTDEKEYLAANHRKIFIAMAKDVRVILIKLVDRLHNMRTLQYMKPEKQKKIASETLDVYAPIAHRLGISEIKNELEDLCFQYLKPEKYYEIAKLVEMRKSERDEQVQSMIQDISQLLVKNNIPYRVFGRSKHLYSIYKKMVTKNKRFEEVLDLLAIRIVTDTDVSCYEILGHIHATYRPIPGRFKDYIAMPKMNMYQSLHTTIVADEGNIFEVQLRTEVMDAIAERGIAAHWFYKENSYHKEQQQREIEEQLHWFKDFTLMSEEISADATAFMDTLIKDIFEANVYVMSPKGRVINLPNGATPLDFAYRIHTEVGHQTIGALINGVLTPLNTTLKTGDVVTLKTNKNSGPSEDWLKIVKSSNAKNKIKAYFQKIELKQKEEGASKGKDMLEAEIKRRNLDVKEVMDHKKVDQIAHEFNLHTSLDVYYAIYSKSLNAQVVIEKLTNNKGVNLTHDNQEVIKMLSKHESPKKKTMSKHGLKVAGIDGMLIHLAPCCSPVYGDVVKGFITKGQGVKVHRGDCPNIERVVERLIDVEWEEDFHPTINYEVQLVIYSSDRNFLLSDIVTVVAQCKAGLQHVDSKVNDDGIHATTRMVVLVKELSHLQGLMTNLKKITSVKSVERVIL